MKVLFIHRSVGQHLLKYGKLRQLLNVKNIQIDDYNNNSGLVTYDNGQIAKDLIAMPGKNTNPDNLAAYFSNWSDILNGYDLVMVKSCYPNSHIKSDEQLEKIKNQYQSIIKSFVNHNKLLLVLTTPPLRPLMTNKAEAKRADELASWLTSQSNNFIHVFDFRKLLTNKNGMLKASYRHWSMPWDNHPKAKAHKNIAPQLIKLITSIS